MMTELALPPARVKRKIEQMDDNVSSLLRRLGVTRGARNLKSAAELSESDRRTAGSRAARGPASIEELLKEGTLVESAEGACFVVERTYPAHYRHGPDALADLLEVDPNAAADYAIERRIAGNSFRDFLFLDTETTGLAGAGALAFMVGVAYFESRNPGTAGAPPHDVLIVRQYFLRDHADEPAMLRQLEDLLTTRAGLITFNGRSFDMPLLDNRYLLNRMPSPLVAVPNIDLLLPARRLFRARLGSCALGALEKTFLGLERTHEDVPGWLIPSLYNDYLLTGDARELLRVFYHNEIDMLSMVTLAARIFRLLSGPLSGEPLDRLSLGRWQAELGMNKRAEQTLRELVDDDLPLEAYHKVLQQLGVLYKKTGRRQEAVVAWQQMASTATHDVHAHVELAKHFEWRVSDVASALVWTERALALVERWVMTPHARLTRAELLHRLERLQAKSA